MFAVDDVMSRCQRLWWIVIWMITPVVCGGSDWWSVVIGKMSWLLIYGHNNHHSHNQTLIGKLLAVYTIQHCKQKHTISILFIRVYYENIVFNWFFWTGQMTILVEFFVPLYRTWKYEMVETGGWTLDLMAEGSKIEKIWLNWWCVDLQQNCE